MSLHTGGSSRTKRTAFMELHEGNVLFDANSMSNYSHIIQIDDEPVIVRGHHMDIGDEVLVEIVDGSGGGEHFSSYQRKGKQVKLTHKCNVIALSIPGRYRFKLVGSLGTVFVNSYKASMSHEFLQEALETSCCTTCDEEVWVDTGLTRCVGELVEKLQESQTGAKRWVEDGSVKWVDTGNVRCVDTKVEKQQANQCGQTQWVDGGSLVWTETGVTRCTDVNLEVQEVNQCGLLRWSIKEPIHWKATGEERCNANHFVEVQESNQCGYLRWRVTTQQCGFDASYPLPGQGFMYQPGDVVDPAANVEMKTCSKQLLGWLYPTPRPGATVAVKSCQGEVIGYAKNRSDVAPICNAACDAQNQSIEVSVYPEITVNARALSDVSRPPVEDMNEREKAQLMDAFDMPVLSVCTDEVEKFVDTFGEKI